mgnify:CR=1 FL=1
MNQNPPRNPLTNEQSPFLPITMMVLVAAVVIAVGVPKGDPATARATPTPLPAPTQVAAAPAQPTVAPTPADHRMLMALGLEEVPASAVQAGQRLYNTACTACHGLDARGIAGLGKTLIGSSFVDSLHDPELVAFIAVGRTPSDPLNTTGMPMPARGGNTALTDDDLYAIVAYIRSLNGARVIEDAPQAAAAPLPALRPFEPIPINTLPEGLVPASYISAEGQPLEAWLRESFPRPVDDVVPMTAEEWQAFVDYLLQPQH